jgi:hypothetical protein
MTGGSDRAAHLWSRDLNKEIGVALEHPSTVSAVAFRLDRSGLLLSAAAKIVHLRSMSGDGAEGGPVIAFRLQYTNPVQCAAFTPGDDRLFVMTQSWAYYYGLSESGPVPISSRPLPGSWVGAYHWREEADSIDLSLLDTGDSLRIARMSLDPRDVPVVSGEPEDLLFEWQRRLGRRVSRDA